MRGETGGNIFVVVVVVVLVSFSPNFWGIGAFTDGIGAATGTAGVKGTVVVDAFETVVVEVVFAFKTFGIESPESEDLNNSNGFNLASTWKTFAASVLPIAEKKKKNT